MKRIEQLISVSIGIAVLIVLSASDTATPGAMRVASEFWEGWGGAVPLSAGALKCSLPAPRFVECIVYGTIERVHLVSDPEVVHRRAKYAKYEIHIEEVFHGKAAGTIDVFTQGSMGIFREGRIGVTMKATPYSTFLPTAGHIVLVAVRWPRNGPDHTPLGPSASLRNKLWIGAAFVPLADGTDVGFVDGVDWRRVTAQDINNGILPPDSGIPITTPLGLSVRELGRRLALLYGE